jgi:NAD(P)-dependent dehydrogenase (short-subunit alcohol dehydrogenase family)
MRIFLTGATGFVGRNMRKRLMDEGHGVRALLRGLPGQKARLVQGFHKEGEFAYLPGDVVSGAGLEQGMLGCDAVVHLGGADELTLNELLKEIARCAGISKPAVHIPMPLMFAGAALARLLPNPPVTPDQLRMLQEGSTCDIGPMKRIFNFEPRTFEGCGR